MRAIVCQPVAFVSRLTTYLCRAVRIRVAVLAQESWLFLKTPIPLGGDPTPLRNFGQNAVNRSRNGNSAVEAP
ncbi:MAG: hypothetical protein AB2693_29470 [Candidatus Thiodiazotropha sp.]